jgi:exonuclease III
MLSILSWNIQQGGGIRTIEITRAIAKSAPDIIIFSEFRNNENGAKIRSRLLLYGYLFQFVTNAMPQENSVLIASKIACNSTLYPHADPEYSANILSIQMEAFNLMGVYLPHKKKHNLLPFIIDTVIKSSTPYIIAGDFNTGKNYLDQKGNSFWYTDQLEKLEASNYSDAFRHMHKDVKEFSWYSHQGNGYRYDHTYVHSSILPVIKTCHYNHAWREEKLSDHSAMVLVLGV